MVTYRWAAQCSSGGSGSYGEPLSLARSSEASSGHPWWTVWGASHLWWALHGQPSLLQMLMGWVQFVSPQYLPLIIWASSFIGEESGDITTAPATPGNLLHLPAWQERGQPSYPPWGHFYSHHLENWMSMNEHPITASGGLLKPHVVLAVMFFYSWISLFFWNKKWPKHLAECTGYLEEG